jgi:spore coat polysaccharide biosynthesis protein SpsF
LKIVAIIQARMGSSRLPGKVLKKVLNKTLLDYQLERVKRANLIDEIVIATTLNQIDDDIVQFCESMSIPYYRGSEQDVLSRYYEAAVLFDADVIVRLTADNPLIDPQIIDRTIAEYLNDHTLDYASNTIERTYPRGMDTEVFSFALLEKLNKEATSPLNREHVTSYISEHPSLFRITQVKDSKNESRFRLTVDTPKDFLIISQIIEILYKRCLWFSYEDILNLLNEREDLQSYDK